MRSTWRPPLRQQVALAAVLAVCIQSALATPPPLRPPPPSSKHSRRQVQPSLASLYAPSFLPTPLPEEEAPIPAFRPHREHKLTQPKKPVYHYTPIKPFSEEELGDSAGYKGKIRGGFAPQTSRFGFAGGERQLFRPALAKGFVGPQVHEFNGEPALPAKPIRAPTPIAPEPAVHVAQGVQLAVGLPLEGHYNGAAALIPDTELVDIKAIQLGETVGVGGVGGVGTSAVVQRQNPAHEKYHFEYRVRDHLGDFGHAEAKDGSMTSGGYDVNLHKTHVQSVRYFVDSKEVPVYAHQYHHHVV